MRPFTATSIMLATLSYLAFASHLAHASLWQEEAVAQSVSQAPVLDSEIEQQLDDMLNSNLSEEEMRSRMVALEQTLDARAPAMSRVRLMSYIALSNAYLGEVELAYQQLDDAQQLALKSALPDALAEVAGTRILVKTLENKLTEAYTLLNTAIVPLESAQLPRVRYFVHNLIASVYTAKNKPERAFEHLIAAAQAVDETNDERTPIRRTHLSLRVAAIDTQQRRYEQALQRLDEATQAVQQAGLEAMFIPEIEFQRAYVYSMMEEYDRAFEIYKDLESQIKDDPTWVALESTVLNNLGDLAIRTERYESGIEILQQALAVAEAQNDVITEQMIRFNLGFIQVHLDNFDVGLNAMQEVVEQARDTWLDSEFEPLLGEFAEALTMAGRHQQANQVLLEQRGLREEIFNTNLQKNVTELQNLYDSQDKAQQIELLERQNDLNAQLLENERQRQLILILGVVVALLLSTLAFYLYRAARRSNLALQSANAKLADQSIRDPLTGLLNRRAMQQELQRQEAHPKARSDAMVLIDIDHFKRINDHHGHAAGDEVIKAVAQRLIDVCRDNDKVIRWGGEEFLIYLTETSHDALPRFVLRLLQQIASKPVTTENGKQIDITCTAGFISYPFADLNQQQMDWEATLQLVDKALYAGKVHGRNQAWGIVSLNVPYEQAHKVLDTDLARAIEDNYVSAVTLHGPQRA